MDDIRDCPECEWRNGTPPLCPRCAHNRRVFDELKELAEQRWREWCSCIDDNYALESEVYSLRYEVDQLKKELKAVG